ncbi:response regulator [Echinicola shivajiensis]|uniref:response regulator n=1 Tax=Echinicola shivajiensis TaxID=1035916 RepID=UPI001BFCBD31|nr:response regulator [Echinicola shivajiensis]
MKSSFRIPLIYILIGSAWVAFSSFYLGEILEEIGVAKYVWFEVFKAVFFVIVSGVLIYFLVDRALVRERNLWSSYFSMFMYSPIYKWLVRKEEQTIFAVNLIAEQNFESGRIGKKDLEFNEVISLSEEDNARIFSEGNCLIQDVKVKDKNGNIRVLDLYTIPLKKDANEFIVITAVDNTDLRKTLKEKTQLNTDLRQQNDLLKKYSYMNSHNLRRPLSNILGIINLIDSNGKKSEDIINLLKQSSEQLDIEVRKMNDILNKDNLQVEMSDGIKGGQIKSVLVVDDDKVQHMINRRILLKCNPDLELHFFDNPIEALDWIKNNSVDKLLLDINMPEMKGWEFLDHLIELGIYVDVKMLSSSIDPRDEEKSKQYDMISGFLTKPLRKEALDDIL